MILHDFSGSKIAQKTGGMHIFGKGTSQSTYRGVASLALLVMAFSQETEMGKVVVARRNFQKPFFSASLFCLSSLEEVSCLSFLVMSCLREAKSLKQGEQRFYNTSLVIKLPCTSLLKAHLSEQTLRRILFLFW